MTRNPTKEDIITPILQEPQCEENSDSSWMHSTVIVRKDYQVGSITIPKGAVVQAPIWDIHHDPELWPDPWKFDPNRFSPGNKAFLNSMAYMPFGIGRRNCIAEKFALTEAKLAIFRLVKKFRFEACEKTDDPLPLVCLTAITNPAGGVYLRAVPRSNTL
ncbi:Cytochrome P450 3A28 [Araneus ventricosus]|uniref:Cytochrome P450 3A28 n=1 Tax=Araneus ventricosus TaxID=182803 RepID=A0A4Y2M7X3_ARAVE|nr:Cytochrome P450 3A28 [Araneus ventricosus]